MRFGTDGVRGPAGVWPIDVEGARRIGAAAARLAGVGGSVVVARDTRPSGPELADAVCKGIIAAGGTAVDAGVLPTPAVAWAVSEGIGTVGVVVTASHNPAADNGFKLFATGGRKLSADQTAQVEEWLSSEGAAADGGSRRDAPEVTVGYLTALRAVLGVDLTGRRIAVDVANGAATPLAAALGELCGATVVPVAAGDGVINAGCGATHPERVAETTRIQGLDGGFAVDGDADRCVLVTADGDVVPGDALTLTLARARGVTGLAVTVMSTAALEGQLPGVRVVRTPVGDKHLQRAMTEHNLPLGAEESGHVLFDDWPGGDGLLTGFRALAACFATEGTVADAMTAFVAYPRDLSKVTVAAKPSLDDVVGYPEALAGWQSRLDGGRVFIRYSGTEPVVRILVEGPDAAVVAQVAADAQAWVSEALS